MLVQSHINTPAPARQWFIQVSGQAYGPFDDKMLWQYMCEGRVTAQSLVSQSATQHFRPVNADPSLMNWLSQVPDNKPKDDPTPTPTAKRSVFVIMAEIRSGRGMNFLQMLQGLGQVERVGDTLWLLQAAATADEIRNVLSQPLSSDDRLFVLDSFANNTSWFNIGADMDRRIQALWDIER